MVSQLHSDDVERDPRVRAVLDAASAPTEVGPLPGEEHALAAFRAEQLGRRSFMPSSLTRVRAAVAATLGAGVLLAAGTGAAAAGVLPGAAQDTARTVLDRVGIEVPGANERSAGHADQRGHSEQSPGHTEAANDGGQDRPATDREMPEASEHGKTVSSTARNTDAEGDQKGNEVSGVASDGRARNGGQGNEHGRTVSSTARTTDAQGADKGKEVSGVTSDGRARSGGQAEEHAQQPPTGKPDDAGKPEDAGEASDAGRAKADAAGTAGKTTADDASDGRRTQGGNGRP